MDWIGLDREEYSGESVNNRIGRILRGLIAYRVQYFSNNNGINRAFNGPI